MSKLLQFPTSWESIGQRISAAIKMESFQSFVDKSSNYECRGKEKFTSQDNVIRILGRPEISPSGNIDIIKEFDYAHNLVTDSGDIYYAKQGVAEAPSANEDFENGRMELRTGAATPAKGHTYSDVTTPTTASRKVFETSPNYPLADDQDGDNTGAGTDIVTYLNNYTTGDFNQTSIIGGTIHDNASPVGGTLILNHYSITSFNKTASDTLKMIVNHTMTGV